MVPTLSNHRLMALFLILSITLIFAAQSAYAVLINNLSKRVSIVTQKQSDQPLEITGITVGEQEVKLGDDFQADADWLKTLAIKVKNVSAKDIVYIQGEIEFIGNESIKLPRQILPLGQNLLLPPSAVRTGEPLLLPSSQQAVLRLPAFAYQYVQADIAREGHDPDIQNDVMIRIYAVVFADDTAWIKGGFLSRDPENPRHWKAITQDKQTAQLSKPPTMHPAAYFTKRVASNASSCKVIDDVFLEECASLCFVYIELWKNATNTGRITTTNPRYCTYGNTERCSEDSFPITTGTGQQCFVTFAPETPAKANKNANSGSLRAFR